MVVMVEVEVSVMNEDDDDAVGLKYCRSICNFGKCYALAVLVVVDMLEVVLVVMMIIMR